MEMMLQQSLQRAGSSISGGCRPGPRPAAPMMAMAAATKQELKRERKDGDDAEEGGGTETEQQLRRGPWTVDEDLTLINYIAEHGEGRWNALARAAGLKRTGKSCRLRWLNYLRPDVKRGDFTADEQLLILDLHSRWGNRWSKIAAALPGRTDNEIKNYWRTRVQKHAKQLNCDVNSKRFKDAMRFLWMPRLAERAAAQQSSLQQAAISGDGHGLDGSALTTAAVSACCFETMMMNVDDDRSPCSVDVAASSSCSSRTSSESATTTGQDDKTTVPASHGDWVAMQRADHEFWSTASALQHLTAGGGADHQLLFQDHMPLQDLSGWVQGFSEGVSPADTLWSLDDIWRMQ